jgi:hypothetical protein
VAGKRPRDPFDVALGDEARKRLGTWLCDQVQDGINARASNEIDVDYWWTLYEQARTRTGKNAPWPDAADLTSYLASEKVDALHARIMRTVFGAEPLWTVEGWGDAADRAPIVEEFHQWKAEEERLQTVVDRLILQALVEPRGLLEIAEGTEMRKVRKRIQAALQLHPETGGPIFGEDGHALVQQDDSGPVESTDPNMPSAETVVDSYERVRTGPVYRLLPYRDSLILPGHARDQDEITAYFKRFWRRSDVIQQRADAGVYDPDAVEKITPLTEREVTLAQQRAHMDTVQADKGQAEHELWEGVILCDLAALLVSLGVETRIKPELRGERWYLVTIHPSTQGLLRIQHDDMERSRFVSVVLFPRHDRVTEGFSFVGHKLITTIEEHTAWRNMAADRASMVVQAPIKRLQGALWDPAEQPFGPRAVIDVRDMREVEPLVVPDFTAPVLQHIQMMERTAERLAGINDVASGQVAQESRTLGEVQMATEQSFVRMDLVVKRFQEAFEDVAQIRHAIWKRTLAENPEGEDAPAALLSNLEGRGVSLDEALPDRRVTALMLEGAFRFKPHGSVETADPGKQRNDFVQALQALPALLQAFPMLGIMFSSPMAARVMGRQFLRLFKVPNQQAFLGTPSQDLAMTGQLNAMPPAPAMPMPMGMPGMGGPMPGMGMGQPPMGGPPMAAPPMGDPGGFPPAA